MTSASARAVALEALLRVNGGAYSNITVPNLLRATTLDQRDRAFVTELVYGTLRRRRAIDALLEHATDRRVDALDPPVRAALRLGAYQLLSGTPAYAAVSETVAVAPKRARGYVNAVLRRLASTGPEWPGPDGGGGHDDDAALGVRLSYPDWIVERLISGLGERDARAALEAMNEPAAVMLRTNVSRTTADALGAELRTAGVGVEPGTLATGAWRVRAIGDPAALPAVREGRATPQDEASQAVVDVLDPQPEQRVLDTCAAPGGKATGAAERMRDAGTVVAIDLHRGRLNLVRRAAARLRLRSVHGVLADARTLPAAGAGFDRVLVDAPCSGLGVLRRRPEARWRVRPEAVPVLAELQRELLAAAAPALRPGGLLVYSVCTLTREETLEVGTWAAAALDGLVAMDPPGPPWRSWGSGALLLPQDADTDGMYVARFRRP